MSWITLEPNEHGDWISKRNDTFSKMIPLAPEKKFDLKTISVFTLYSMGVATNRDAWAYNSSVIKLEKQMKSMVDFYNDQVDSYLHHLNAGGNTMKVEDFVSSDKSKISWSSSLIPNVAKGNKAIFEPHKIFTAMYRPFFKQCIYWGDKMIHRRGQFDNLFPNTEKNNLVICTSGVGANKDFSLLITDTITDLQVQSNDQCFPLYWYDDSTRDIADLFSTSSNEMDKYIRRDGVSDHILKVCREQYGTKSGITKEEIFYYVYGIFHSPDYRTTFEADLKKMLPRLPLVYSTDDFKAFCNAGRALADLHLNYESVEPYKGAIVAYDAGSHVNYHVEKMRFGKNGKAEDKSTIIYNHQITVSNIPLEAYDYIVNGKSAIDWIMERYAVTINKESGICNDPNDWATEHGDEKYILRVCLKIFAIKYWLTVA